MTDPQVWRLPVRLSPGASRVAHSLPDGILAVLFALAATAEVFPNVVSQVILEGRNELYFSMYVEAGFLILQLALVDMGTRLDKQLPTGAIIAIVVALILFLGLPMAVLRAAWAMGLYVFMSMLLSLIERGAILRRLPERPRIEKIAARALISNRIVAALTLLGSFVAAIVIVVALTPREWPDESWPPLAAGAVYFAIAAFDDWRVRGRRFAERPRALFGYEVLRIRQLDPL
ncbi:MAG TPA: hypothetical protein VEO54_21190 [Thermoanaerobaculia bacterium]|nr:hypothetical protein [Thermoanaerobaculia bacterium]